MNKYLSSLLSFILLGASAWAGEQSIVSIRDFTTSELKYAGIDISQPIKVHILALGGGDEGGWGSKSNGMFAYGWIINAETKDLVWEMTWDNTSESSDDRKFDGTIELAPGKYEVYFTAFAFAEHSTFSHFLVNLDHRKSDLFGSVDQSKHDFFGWLKDLWSGDMQHDFFKRAPKWGIDLLVDQSVASTVNHFNPPLEPGNTVSHAIGLGDNQCIRIAFELRNETTLNIYAIGEQGRENDLPDGGWIVNLTDRKRVWDMERTV